MSPIFAVKGDRLGTWDPEARRFTPYPPGRAYQVACARFVAARQALAGLSISTAVLG